MPPPDPDRRIESSPRAEEYGVWGYLRVWWKDERLAFDDGTGTCVNKISLGLAARQQIWKPDLYWEGARKISFPRASDGGNGVGEMLEVYPDGSIFWSRQSHFVLSCKTSDTLDRMPFDTQVRPESETACRARSTPHG